MNSGRLGLAYPYAQKRTRAAPFVKVRLEILVTSEAGGRGTMRRNTASRGETSRVPPPVPAPTPPIDRAMLQLLSRWRCSDATTDAKEIDAAERDLAEFKRAMNANRSATSEPPLFP